MKKIIKMKIKILILFSLLLGVNSAKSQCPVAATVTNNCTWGDMIEAYTLNGIPVGPANNWCSTNGYNYFASPVWTLTSGGTYTFSADAGLSAAYNEGFAIWIDLNGDNQFAASEMLFSAAVPAMTHTGSVTLTGATTGLKRMRIMCSYTTVITGTQACTSDVGSFGEIEDYNVFIQTSCPPIAPNLTVTASSPSFCIGGSATLTGTGANTYTWQPGNLNGNSIAVNPTVTTTYTLTGSITSCTTVPIPTQITITVSPSQTPTLSITGNTVICAGQSTTLTASGASTYTWSNAVINASVSVTPTVSVVYSVTGTSTAGCIATISKSVTVNPLPVINITGSSTLCSGNTVILTASGATSYTWNTGPLTSTIALSPVVNSSYTVSGSNGICIGTAVKNLSVSPSPTIAVSGNTLICGAGTVTLVASGANTYSWSTGPITSSISASPSVSTVYTVVGTNTVGSCTSLKTVSVIVSINPTVAISGSMSICNGQTTILTATGANTYSWSNTAATATVALSPTTTTGYTVVGTNTAGCIGTNFQTVTVNPSPTVLITGGATICLGAQPVTLSVSGANTYSWNTGATSTTIVVSPTITTTYSATGTSSVNGCANTGTTMIVVSPCTGIDNLLPSIAGLSIYPNPNNGEFTIELKNGLNKTISVYDFTGKMVLSSSTIKDKISVDISSLVDGIYYVSVQSENTIKTVKVVKQ